MEETHSVSRRVEAVIGANASAQVHHPGPFVLCFTLGELRITRITGGDFCGLDFSKLDAALFYPDVDRTVLVYLPT